MLAILALGAYAARRRQTEGSNLANTTMTNPNELAKTAHELSERLDSLQGQIQELQREPQRVRHEAIRVSYTEYGNQVRHFSTVRSALTTFLLTVSMTAFSAYFTPGKSHAFLAWVGGLFLFGAVVACFAFSYRTERELLRYRHMWQYLTGKKTMGGAHDFSCKPPISKVVPNMLRDPMNLLMIPAVILIIAVVRYYALRMQ
jgi:uncharacterized protein YukE